MLKIIRALQDNAVTKDTKPTEKLLNNQVRLTIEQFGDKYLKNADDILQFEATSKEALDATLDVLDSDKFKEKYVVKTKVKSNIYKSWDKNRIPNSREDRSR